MAGTFALTGMEALQARLAQLGASLPAVAAAALYREAERIMAISKTRVPVETGALRASGQVLTPVIAGTAAAVTMGYGNAAVGYAVYVHEILTSHHPVGEAKFLERPLNEAQAGMDARLGADIAKEVERLAGAK